MGFLLDLLRRWFGVPRTLEAAPPASPAAASSPRPAAEAEPPAPAPVAAPPPTPPEAEPRAANSLPWLATPPEPPAEVDSPEPSVEVEERTPLADAPEPPAPADTEPTPAVELADPAQADAPELHGPAPTVVAAPTIEIEEPVALPEPSSLVESQPLVTGPPAEDRDDSDAHDVADSPEVDSPSPAEVEAEFVPEPPAEVEPEAADDPIPEPETAASIESPGEPAVEAPAAEGVDLPDPGEPAESPRSGGPVEPEAVASSDRAVAEPTVAAPVVASPEPPAPPAVDDAASPEAVAAGPTSAGAPLAGLTLDSPGAIEAAPDTPPADEGSAEAGPPVLAASAEEEASDATEDEAEVTGLPVADPEAPEARADVAPPVDPKSAAVGPAEEERDAAIDLPLAAEMPAEDDPVVPSNRIGEDEEHESPPGIEMAEGDEGEMPAVAADDDPESDSPAPEVDVEAGPSLETVEPGLEVVRSPEAPAGLDLFAGPATPELEPDTTPEADEPVDPAAGAEASVGTIAEGATPPVDDAAESAEVIEPPLEAGTDLGPADEDAPPTHQGYESPVGAAQDEVQSPVAADGPDEIDLFAAVAPEPEVAAGLPAEGATDAASGSGALDEDDRFAADEAEVDAGRDEVASPVEGESPVEVVEDEVEPEAPTVASLPDGEVPVEEPPGPPFEAEPYFEAGFLPPFEEARPAILEAEPPAEPEAGAIPSGLADADLAAEAAVDADPAAEPESIDPFAMPAPVAAHDSPAEAPPRPAPLGLAGDLESPLWAAGGADVEAPAEDPAARAVRRAERRAAAAGAREARRAAAAERRATDIIYLGRGVSEALHDRTGDSARLDALGLPRLDSPAELAGRLGIAVGRLRWLAFHAEVASRVHYVGFEVPKRGGGMRHLSAPHRSLAEAQRWVFEEIVARLPVGAEAHGFVPGRSIVTNARPHAGQAVVVNLDLEGFFPGIGFRRVRAVFERAGYSPALATILGLLCTEAQRRAVTLEGATLHVATGPRGLPQGACTSPGLSNQVARRLDRRLAGLARSHGATYTRYADDLTFSGDPALDPKVGHLLAQVRRIAASEGFRVNEAKTRVQRPNAAQTVTGLVVNDRPGVARAEVRRLRAILHRARVEGLDAQNHEGHPDFRAYLEGMIAFVGMARPEVGARLRERYDAL